MNETNLVLREATPDDCEDILIWRNDPISLKMSKNSKKVTSASHRIWFEDTLADNSKLLLLAINAQSKKIAVSRLDFCKSFNRAKVSININPDFRGKGLGEEILNHTSRYVDLNYKNCKKLVAEIKEFNHASRKIFERAGYKLVEKNGKYLKYINIIS